MAEQTYTIKEIAGLTGISRETIRYYEKIALLPRADRKDNGHRVYREHDIRALRLIACLKKTGMPLEEMRPFLTVSAGADPEAHPGLIGRIRRHRDSIVSQIAALRQIVDMIDSRLEEGGSRRDCAEESRDGAKHVSSAERRYFPATVEAGGP